MSDFAQRVETMIANRRLFRCGESILIAVSGGVDSMVLLHLLARLAQKNQWRLFVTHFNHQLRGRSSDADERLVAKNAATLVLPFFVGRADVRKYSRDQKLSLEMAARKLRHSFLARTAANQKIKRIALAHHADDQVELFFLRLLRGAGSEGLAGMKSQNSSPADHGVTLVRPLLEETKKTLLAFAKKERIEFREDTTNAHLDFQRNRIRHELLPLLIKNYQPALDRIISRQMEILGAESDFIREVALAWLKKKRRAPFDTLLVAVQRRCIQLQLSELKLASNFDSIEQLRLNVGQPVELAPKKRIIRNESGIIQFVENAATSFGTQTGKFQLKGRAGQIEFNGIQVVWSKTRGNSGTVRAVKREANCEHFDSKKVGSTVILRHWQPGDRFQPIGMTVPVKLQDLFTNQKIPRCERRRLVVATTGNGDIFWVEGLRMAERFKLDKRTADRLKWSWQRKG